MTSGIISVRDIKISPEALKLNRRYSMKHCSISGCERNYGYMGYCATHAYRVKMYGDPLKLKEPHIAHGFSKEPLYKTWTRMKSRILNENGPRYHDYGGRGLTLHAPWADDYRVFREYVLENLGEKPHPRHTIDRIDNDKGYEPGNIRWATNRLQIFNRRDPKNTTGYPGVKTDGNGFDANIQYKGKTIFIGYFRTAKEAGEAYQQKKAELKNLMEVSDEV